MGWLDEPPFAGACVEAYQPSVLRLGVHDRRVLRVDLHVEAVAAHGDVPVLVGDAVGVARAAGAAEGVVVLGSAVDVVEGLLHVDRNGVELGYR